MALCTAKSVIRDHEHCESINRVLTISIEIWTIPENDPTPSGCTTTPVTRAHKHPRSDSTINMRRSGSKDNLMVAKIAQSYHVNKHRRDDPKYKIGDSVMLSTLNRR